MAITISGDTPNFSSATITTGTVTTLTTTTISDGTNSTSATNCIQGSAKAWVNFGYVSGSITNRASYNVSSIVRNASGDYTVNFTNALVDANYSLVGTASYGSSAAPGRVVGAYPIAGAYLASSIRVASGYYNAFEDEVYVNLAIFR